MHLPSLEDVRRLASTGNLLPIYRILPADLETPVSVYLKLRQAGKSSFLLESVEKGEQMGRYSFIGVDPPLSLTLAGNQVTLGGAGGAVLERFQRDDPLAELNRLLHQRQPIRLPDLPAFTGGAVGFWSYDVVRHFERLPATAPDELQLPDAVFLLAD
ncbi:MAG: anthranilate synthase component I, partial [Caldilineales bacterium]|nr:anthranilate synthase component I [Caldilineales bacterium]